MLFRSNTLAWQLALNKEFSEGLEIVNKALSFEPHKDFIWHTKGYILMNLGKDLEAIDAFDESLRLNNLDSESLQDKSKLLYKLGRYEESKILAQKLLEIDPKNEEILELINSLEKPDSKEKKIN